MGLTIAVKPTLAPMLLIPLLRRQWKVFITAVGVPIVLTAAALPLIKDPMDYLRRTMPYSIQARDYFNSSIPGSAAYWDLPSPLVWFMRIGMAVLVAISVWLLYRYCRNDEVFFLCTTTGVLLTGEFLISGLGQQYYSMMLFPFLMTVVLPSSVLRNWPAWLAIFGFTTYDKWLLDHWQSLGRDLEYLRITFGWGLLVIVTFCVLGDRYLTARREGRLDSGIDPSFLLPHQDDTARPDSAPNPLREAVTTTDAVPDGDRQATTAPEASALR
jgi:arabinofuranan 3-O-arabinosyltransferase